MFGREWSRIAAALPPRNATPGRVAAWAYPLSLVLWASVWHLRNSVLFEWTPVEPVWVASASVGACVLHRLGQRRQLAISAVVPLLVLIVAFAPGAWRSLASGYGPTKLVELALVTLPMFGAAILLLDTRAAKVRWVWAQVLMSAVVAPVALLFSDEQSLDSAGRLALATVDTISTARLIAVGAVALFLLATVKLWPHAWAVVPAAMLTAVMLQVGSRGPALFLVISVAAAILLARIHHARRLLALAAVAGLVIGGVTFVASGAAGGGGQRLLDSSEEGFADVARTDLLDSAIDLGNAEPGGIGWGAFAERSSIGAELANDQSNAYAHNVLAEAYSEGGLIAFLGLLGVIAFAFYRLQRASRDPMMTVAFGVAIFWLCNALVSYDLVGNRFLWLALGCALTSGIEQAEPKCPRRTQAQRSEAGVKSSPRSPV